MSSVYLNGRSWYIRSNDVIKATGYTKPLTKSEVRQKIDALPPDSPIRLLFFDKLPILKQDVARVEVKTALASYYRIINGLSEDGQTVIDANDERNFRKVYRHQFGVIEKRFGGKFLDELTDEKIFLWIKELKAVVRFPTIRGYYYCLNRFLNYCVGRKWIAFNPNTVKEGLTFQEMNGKSTKKLYKHKGMVRELTDQQYKDLLTASKFVSEEFHLYVLASVVTGARQHEILTLRMGNMDLENNRFTVETENAKNRETRTVTYGFNQDLVALFKKYCQGKQPDENLFNMGKDYLYRTFKRIGGKIGLEKEFSARDLRHVAAIKAKKLGMDPFLIAAQFSTSVSLLEKTYTRESQEVIDAEWKRKFAGV